MRRSRVAVAAATLAVLGLVLVGVGPALTLSGLAVPLVGFYVYGLGGLLCGLALLAGLMALYRTRATTGLSGRPLALLGTFVGLAGLLALVGPGARNGQYPPINDITTSLDDPPAFVGTPELAGLGDMSYPDRYRAPHAAGYPDLGPLEVDLAPPDAFDAALAAMQELGMTVTLREPASGRIQGFDVTSLFRFVDDVVVRITPAGAGSRIDIRSRSRDGQGDLGANAKRILRLRDEILASSASPSG